MFIIFYLYTDGNLSSKPPKLQNCCYTATNSNSSYTTSVFNKSKQTHKYYGLLMQYHNIKIPLYAMQCHHVLCKKVLRRDHNSGQDSFVQIWSSLRSECLNSAEKHKMQEENFPCSALPYVNIPCILCWDANHVFRILYTQVSQRDGSWRSIKKCRILAKGNLKHATVWSVIKRKGISPLGAHEVPTTHKAARSRLFYNGIIIAARRTKSRTHA